MHAQEGDSLKKNMGGFTTSLLEFFPDPKLYTANVNLGMEYRLRSKNTLYVNLGYLHPYGKPEGFFGLSSRWTRGLRLQVEKRRYLNRRKIVEPAILLFWPHIFQFGTRDQDNTGYYWAIHSAFKRTQTRRTEYYLARIEDEPYPGTKYYERNEYDVFRTSISIHLKFGYQCIRKRGFIVDYSVGCGAQYLTSHSEGNILEHTNRDIPWNKLFNSGSGFFPSFLYQIRIGWSGSPSKR